MTVFAPASTEAVQARVHAPKTVRPSHTTPTSVSTTAPRTTSDTYAPMVLTVVRLASTVACSVATANAPVCMAAQLVLVLARMVESRTPQDKHVAMEQVCIPVLQQERGQQRALAPMVVTTIHLPRWATATNVLPTPEPVADPRKGSAPQRAQATSIPTPPVHKAATMVTATSATLVAVLVAEVHSRSVPKQARATSTTTPLVPMDAPMATATFVPLVATSAAAQPPSSV